MMLPLNGLKIYLATEPVDFRKGMDGLAGHVMSGLELDWPTWSPLAVWAASQSSEAARVRTGCRASRAVRRWKA